LRAIKEYGGTALVLHPEDAAKPFMPRAAIAARHPDACLPVQKIVRFVDSFGTRYRTLPAGFLPWRAAHEVP
jgi:chemotaxis response regulator CheB